MVPESKFLAWQNDKILRNWFGDHARAAGNDYARLSDDFAASILEADMLGVPDTARIRYESTNDPRGYWGVYFAALYPCTMRKADKFVTPVIHLNLFRNKRFISALRSSRMINTVSCHRNFGTVVRNQLGVKNGMDLIVPGEMGISEIPEYCKKGQHYPGIYIEMCDAIARFEPGSVVLVAAGICGKVYSHLAKKAGCIGLDIGAIADYFMGFNTRRIFRERSFQTKVNFEKL